MDQAPGAQKGKRRAPNDSYLTPAIATLSALMSAPKSFPSLPAFLYGLEARQVIVAAITVVVVHETDDRRGRREVVSGRVFAGRVS